MPDVQARNGQSRLTVLGGYSDVGSAHNVVWYDFVVRCRPSQKDLPAFITSHHDARRLQRIGVKYCLGSMRAGGLRLPRLRIQPWARKSCKALVSKKIMDDCSLSFFTETTSTTSQVR